MLLIVFGASGPTGRLVVSQALAAGYRVRAVTRRPDRFPFTDPALEVVEGDVVDRAAVGRAVAGGDAVISTYGVPYTRHRVDVYSTGMAHILAGMTEHRVDRLVCVTSDTVAPGAGPGDSSAWRLVVHPLLRHVVGRTLYDDMDAMERLVRASDRTWTVVRPGGLVDAETPSPDYRVSTGRLEGHVTSRADLAEVLLHEATGRPAEGADDRGRSHPHAFVEVVSPSASPSLGGLVREIRGRRG